MLVTSTKKANVGTDKFESDINVIISAMVVSYISLLVWQVKLNSFGEHGQCP